MDEIQDEKTWTIVQFIEDDTVEAIPTSWIQGEYCYWPPYRQDKLTNAIKKCEALNISWPRHFIKIFRNATFDEYSKARTKCKEAEYCSASDMLSDRDNNNSKRKRIQKVLSSSSSSSSADDDLPVKLPKLVIKKKKTSAEEVMGNEAESAENIEEINTAAASTSKDYNNQHVTSSYNCCFQQEHQILTDLKNQNHLIRGILTDVLNEVKKRPIAELTAVSNSIFIKFANITFPINTREDFSTFQEEMCKPENFHEAVNELAKYGGSSAYNFIKRSMSAVLGDVILKNYSWLGRKGKERLDQTCVAKLFISAAEKCGFDNKRMVELAIQSYIKRSFERLNAKENKKK